MIHFEGKTARDIGYENNKEVVFKRINAIHIEKFRSMNKRTLPLGENITLISGKNGTMKTSLMGLLAHPFTCKMDAKDYFGEDLKTRHSQVFKLSTEKDLETYRYFLDIVDIDGDQIFEPIRMYPRKKANGSIRHRVTVGKDNTKGLGNFSLNTSFVNFKRLYPIIETNAKERTINPSEDSDLLNFVARGHQRIMHRTDFNSTVPVAELKSRMKSTFGPSEAAYDYSSMSSGEDNLGHILTKMYAFESHKFDDDPEQLQGIFCIDEIEAGLHPVAQENLFDFLFNWSKRHKVQIVATTHSLYLIQYALKKRLENEFMEKRVQVNMLSTATGVVDRNYKVISNPTYNQAYKELTFKDIDDLNSMYKINILCEDKVAEYYMRRIIKTQSILSQLNFMSNLSNNDTEGASWNALESLVKNGAQLLQDSIVVFDADVKKSIKSSKVHLHWLPSVKSYPVEVEIAYYIYHLCNEDKFFMKFNKERDSFINDFAKFNLIPPLESGNIPGSMTKRFKHWAKSDKNFNKYITQYINTHPDYINDFRSSFIESINEILSSKSLPLFEI